MKIKLENVTLLGADKDMEKLKKAFEICEYYFDFADKKLITKTDKETITDTGIKILNREINSLEEYSHFIVKGLNTYVQTDYVLIIQHDGFILNPNAWTDEFLKYDYIGAPWRYTDDKNVGNGGFSLRSKRLLELLANDKNIIETHPEDHHICRTYGEYLTSKGIRFAPEEVAKKFSIEGLSYATPMPIKYGSVRKDELGFHGLRKTDLSNRKDRNRFFEKPYKVNEYIRRR